MKNFKLPVICFVALMAASVSANALEIQKPAISKPSVGGAVKSAMPAANESNKAIMKDQVKLIIKKSDDITTTYNEALKNVANTLLTKEEIAKIQATKNASSKDAKSKEKGAVESAVLTDLAVAITSQEQAAEMTKRVKNLSAEQTAELTKCLENIALASLGYLDVAAESANLLTQLASDPATAMTMGPDLKALKKVATNAPTQAKTVGNITAGLFKLATNAGLKVKQPTSSSSKAKSVSF